MDGSVLTHVFITGAAILGIVFAIWMWTRVSSVTVAPVAPTSDSARDALLEENRGDEAVRPVDLPWANTLYLGDGIVLPSTLLTDF